VLDAPEHGGEDWRSNSLERNNDGSREGAEPRAKNLTERQGGE
jgi:hypothetical protein